MELREHCAVNLREELTEPRPRQHGLSEVAFLVPLRTLQLQDVWRPLAREHVPPSAAVQPLQRQRVAATTRPRDCRRRRPWQLVAGRPLVAQQTGKLDARERGGHGQWRKSDADDAFARLRA